MKKFFSILISLIAMAGCKKPYLPPVITSPNSYLVVEGVINSGSDSTVITLSKTVNLSAAGALNPLPNAIVTVESDQNNTYPLIETSNGRYVVAGLNLDNALRYRLRIKTADNNEYLSDFAPVINTPPIDSVGFTIQSGGIQLYINTHNANSNTRYYRWDYKETWQFHTKYYSEYVTNGQEIVPRTQQVYSCFSNNTSSDLLLGSSAKLSSNVIYQSPLTFVASNSEKIETKYSIMVHQYALSADNYNYYINIKKNTEQLGSIFDAEPSNINGNIHNIANAAEPVIGYVGVGTVQSKRIFVSNDHLPHSWQPEYPYDCAVQDSNWFQNPHFPGPGIENDVSAILVPLGSSAIPTVGFYYKGSISIVGYLSSGVDCVDCTLRGTVATPPFWK